MTQKYKVTIEVITGREEAEELVTGISANIYAENPYKAIKVLRDEIKRTHPEYITLYEYCSDSNGENIVDWGEKKWIKQNII